MVENQKFRARFIQHHNTEAGWTQITDFYPLKGEVIIYDPDENHPTARFKVGIWDGISEKIDDMLVKNLPFISGVDITSQGLAYTLNEDGESYRVTGIGTCTDTDIIIPSVYAGKPVISIGRDAFAWCSNLISMTISNSVTIIEHGAFYDCNNLKSVMIPDSVTSIEEYVFTSCDSLTSIIIPNSVTMIGKHTFQDCSRLKSVTIPNGITDISWSMFLNCHSLTNVSIPESVTNISGYAFSGCRSLTSVIIPDSVTNIGEYAFADCNSNLTIYCETSSPLSGWSTSWNVDNRPVVWGAALDIPAINDKLAGGGLPTDAIEGAFLRWSGGKAIWEIISSAESSEF